MDAVTVFLFTVSVVLVSLALVKLVSPAKLYVIVYGDSGAAGMACVSTIAEKAPFAPIVAGVVTALIVIDTVAPAGGYSGPGAESVPDSVTEASPYVIVCDVRLLKASLAVVIVSVCVPLVLAP